MRDSLFLAASAHGTLSAFYIRSQTLTGVGVLCGCRAGRTFCCRLWASCGLCTFFLQHFFTGIPSLAVVFAGSLCSCAVDLFSAFIVDLLRGSTSVADVYCLCCGGTLYWFSCSSSRSRSSSIGHLRQYCPLDVVSRLSTDCQGAGAVSPAVAVPLGPLL